MLVANNVAHDTRVLKSALALADAGAQVTILGRHADGIRSENMYGKVRIIRVPVPFRLLNKSQQKKVARRKKKTFKPLTQRDIHLIKIQRGLRQREAKETPSFTTKIRATRSTLTSRLLFKINRFTNKAARYEAGARRRLYQAIDSTHIGATWRQDVQEIDDYDLAYTPVIDSLEWDVIHAHDVHHMGTAARAVKRRRADGRKAQWVYDAHELVSGLSVYPPRTRRKVAAYAKLEKEFIKQVSAVITVTQPLADELKNKYSLSQCPTIVMNTPDLTAQALDRSLPGIREVCGLDPTIPLVVYSGSVTSARGV